MAGCGRKVEFTPFSTTPTLRDGATTKASRASRCSMTTPRALGCPSNKGEPHPSCHREKGPFAMAIQFEPSATPTRLPRPNGFTTSPLGQLFINNHGLPKAKKPNPQASGNGTNPRMDLACASAHRRANRTAQGRIFIGGSEKR